MLLTFTLCHIVVRAAISFPYKIGDNDPNGCETKASVMATSSEHATTGVTYAFGLKTKSPTLVYGAASSAYDGCLTKSVPFLNFYPSNYDPQFMFFDGYVDNNGITGYFSEITAIKYA